MKNKVVAGCLVILTIIVILVTYLLNFNFKSKKESEVLIVKNYSNFYTVNSCVNRYITYLAEQDNKSIYLLLDSKYKKKNNITRENLINFLDKIEQNSIFVSTKMYEEKQNKSIVKYYVKGYLQKNENMEDSDQNTIEKKEYYLIVYLDKSNTTFSVEPYLGKIFKG